MKAVVILAVVAACSSPVERRVPSATRMPQTTRQVPPTVACGDDVAIGGAHSADVRYRYLYDERGLLVHAAGAYAAGGEDDSIEYTYDHLGHLTHMVQARGWGGTRVETTATYDTLGDLLDYTTEQASATYREHVRYDYAGFTEAGQPTSETVSGTEQAPLTYRLDYDATGRLASASQGEHVTIYTYDDDARTTTMDTDRGAFVGVVELDEQDRELSETWGGADPSALASDEDFAYEGDRLVRITYRSGTSDAPRRLAPVEIDTFRYECAP